MRIVWLLILGLSLYFSSTHLVAQIDTVNYYSLTLEDLSDVRVSAASKIAQKQSEAPGIVNYFTQKKVLQYGWVSGNDILYRMAGFSPSQDYDRRTVSARGVFEGWNNNHLLLLIDGIQFNDNLYGTAYTWEVTPLIFAKSLEVIRGPSSALYGTNAVNGVLSINTISPKDLDGNGIVQLRAGNQGTRIYDVLVGAENELVGVVAAFNSYQTDGNNYAAFDDSFRTDSLGNPLQFQTNDERSSNYFFAKLEGKKGLSGFSFQYHEHHWNFGTGHGWLFNIPDQPESMNEFRRLATLKYNSGYKKQPLIQEYSIRYQKHGIDWDMRYYPSGAFDGLYPQGVTEYLKTDAEDLLLRAQWTFKLGKGSAILGGVEGSVFLYDGDEAHHSNIDLESTFEPFPNNEFRNMGPWFEFVKDKPVNNTGVFLQYITPKFGDKFQATLSARYDAQFFEFVDIYAPGRPVKQKNFNQLSPRIGLVYTPSKTVTFKALAGRAFRTPSPTEMFGANTFTLASNINELEPETITTFELNAAWNPSKSFQLNLVGFYNSQFDDIIAYSVANANLSTNLYNLSTAGIEVDGKFQKGKVSGFFNYTFNQRVGETIVDTTIAESENELTWVPAHFGNLGLNYTRKEGYISGVFHYQGRVNRRASDITEDTRDFRSDQVDAWTSLDVKLGITILKNAEFGIVLTNALNTDNFLLKNNAYRFDYRQEKRRYLVNILYRF
ncbi:MAG: TonB-dependent receptor plug domain-containing protein [Flammeovirgaceae bacterium]